MNCCHCKYSFWTQLVNPQKKTEVNQDHGHNEAGKQRFKFQISIQPFKKVCHLTIEPRFCVSEFSYIQSTQSQKVSNEKQN
jgi:hypothetical protein